MTCSSKQRHNRQSPCEQPHTGSQTYVGLFVSTNYYVQLHKLYKMNNNLQFIVRHHKQRASEKHYYNNKKSAASSFNPLRQLATFDHVRSLRTTIQWLAPHSGMGSLSHCTCSQGPLRLISCSPKILFSYYYGEVLRSSL